MVKHFEFHPELFVHRTSALDALSDRGFAWLSDYGSIDVIHDSFGLEVCAIRAEADAENISMLLGRLFPDWHYNRIFYEDENGGEIGWKVIITRDPDEPDDSWLFS